MRLMDGFVTTQLLYVAAKLGIASRLGHRRGHSSLIPGPIDSPVRAGHAPVIVPVGSALRGSDGRDRGGLMRGRASRAAVTLVGALVAGTVVAADASSWSNAPGISPTTKFTLRRRS
jgi:hypothetical protein